MEKRVVYEYLMLGESKIEKRPMGYGPNQWMASENEYQEYIMRGMTDPQSMERRKGWLKEFRQYVKGAAEILREAQRAGATPEQLIPLIRHGQQLQAVLVEIEGDGDER